MSCTFAEARDYMLAVFKTAWDATGSPAVYEGVAEAPDVTDDIPTTPLWARATVRHASGFQSSLTGPLEQYKRFSNIGVVIVQVFGKLGDGGVAAYGAAQLVATAYRNSRGIPVWFRNVRINEIGTRSGYQQINVLIEFEYDSVESSAGVVPPPVPTSPSPNIGPFYFNTPLLVWTINHNLGFRPAVEVFSVGGAEIDAAVLHTSVNQTVISFSTATAGSARFT